MTMTLRSKGAGAKEPPKKSDKIPLGLPSIKKNVVLSTKTTCISCKKDEQILARGVTASLGHYAPSGL
jgi:hypothetical protein